MTSIRKASKLTKRANHKIPIYGGWIDIVLCDNISEERERYSKIFGSPNIRPMTTACFSWSGTALYAIFLQNGKVFHGSIAHEAFHAVARIFHERGAPMDHEHDEPAAYLIDWLVETIYKDLRRWKNSIR